MKSVQLALAAAALAVAFSACAQTPAANAQPQGATETQAAHRAAAKPAQPKDECVGPASFCNIYFGS